MEPESSLPHSQVPTTCSYPEQTINPAHSLISLLEYPLFQIYALVLPVFSFPWACGGTIVEII